MKKRSKKLSLNRETLRDLNPDHLSQAVGGDHTEEDTCATCSCTCVTCDTCTCTARTCPP